MSEMRPVTDKEVRDAAERLRQTKAADDATDAAGVLPGVRREHVDVVAGEHAARVRGPAGWCQVGLDGQAVGVMLTRS